MFSNFVSSLLLALLVSKTVLCQTLKAPRSDATAQLVAVNFDKCDKAYGRPTKETFYRTIYVNLNQKACQAHQECVGASYYTMHWGNSVKLNWVGADWAGKTLDITDTVCNNCINCRHIGKWVALDTQKDIRKIKPEDLLLDIQFYGGYGQMYIPFLHPQDSGLADGGYYMLHLYNDDWVWNDGNQYGSEFGGVKLYKMWGCNSGYEYYNGQYRRLNVTALLNGLGDTFTSSSKDAFISSSSSIYKEMTAKNSREVLTDRTWTTEEFCGLQDRPPGAWKQLSQAMRRVWDYGSLILGFL